ncbi:MAG: hypothetical protein QM426_06375 [Euryarchaeota archaeon]|nr:hypothetical protein [Euryarchaeota archaeon]
MPLRYIYLWGLAAGRIRQKAISPFFSPCASDPMKVDGLKVDGLKVDGHESRWTEDK